MPSEIYEGQVRISTTDKDNNPLVIKNGKRAGQPYCKVSFKVGEEWVNLVDFSNEAADFGGQVCKVAYSQKVDDFGDPVLYNGKPQWNLDAIKPVAGQNGPNPAAPQGQATPTPQAPYNPGLGAMQTALNCATQVNVAVITAGASPASFDYVAAILEDAGRFHEALLRGSLLSVEQAVAEKLDAKPLKDDDELGFDDDPPF